MLKYILKRLLNCLIVIFISVTAVFFAIRLVPSNIVDPKLPLAQQEQIKEQLGLNKPVVEQYVNYLGNVAQFDLGKSLKVQKNIPVTKLIGDKMAISLPIGITAVAISIVIGTVLGTVAAVKRGKPFDHVTTLITVLGISIPSIVISILLQLLFTTLGFPTIYSPGNIFSLVAPVIALSFWPIAMISKYIRNELIDVMNSEYILLAEAKGVSNKTVLFKHALRNAVIPAITVVGPLFVSTIIGSLVVEKVFAIPGLGGLMSQAINTTDYPIIQGLTILFAALFTLAYLVIDILYGIIDPRIRLSGGNS
ncbi:ABC transporter permease [Culicoidibacter larvae]|uniref:ABC transporter permease n=1 Tax=Culicoidibacter larvae TaxID=2579976 RepID=A0A5R8QC11_9FIRM|nr:ABC transporter permease [Culicoidibacter larvae]TLG73830.1 ABC transporter permease [Culicoidibacter larvae]